MSIKTPHICSHTVSSLGRTLWAVTGGGAQTHDDCLRAALVLLATAIQLDRMLRLPFATGFRQFVSK
jgi:hypothetical protein